MTPFTQSGLTTEEADRLLLHYQRNDIPARRSLNIDPRLWDITVLTTERRYNPPTPHSMQNRMYR